MENELKSYMSNVDEVVSLLKQKVERIEKERDEWKAKYDELNTKYDNILATESGHESKTENVWQSGFAAGHEAASERGKWEAQPGAVWVKAEKVRDSIGIPYHAKDEESKGAGTFDVNGHFTWGDGSITFRHCQDDLLILDESAAGMEEDKAHFDNWHRWLSDNGYTYDGEYYYDEDNNYFTPDQLWVKFK